MPAEFLISVTSSFLSSVSVSKFTLLSLIICLIFGGGCKNNGSHDVIPSKVSVTDNAANTSPINSKNLDYYMFRDDVQYIDLRSGKMILEEGYVSGFKFVPYYSIIASFAEKTTLYQMKTTVDSEGKTHSAGQVGGFVAQYEESESIINSLFDKNKYIFLISQGGSESAYLINLLIQLGYNGNLLYNVGGVSNSEGVTPYRDIKTNKYYVSGIGNYGVTAKYDFFEDLTPIN